jgi:hypothetical protein
MIRAVRQLSFPQRRHAQAEQRADGITSLIDLEGMGAELISRAEAGPTAIKLTLAPFSYLGRFARADRVVKTFGAKPLIDHQRASQNPQIREEPAGNLRLVNPSTA